MSRDRACSLVLPFLIFLLFLTRHELDQSVKLALDAFYSCVDLVANLIALQFDRLIDVSARSSLHDVVFLCVFIDGRLQLRALAPNLDLYLLRLALDDPGQLANGAFPVITLLVGCFKRSHDKHIDLAVHKAILCRQDGCEIAQELELRSRSIDNLLLNHFVEAVAHDGDQHVEHRQL